jgi:predicted Zn-dependent protease
VRKQDLIPVGLLGIIAGFIVVQVISTPRSRVQDLEPAANSQPSSTARPGPTTANAPDSTTTTATAREAAVADTTTSTDSTGRARDVDVVQVPSTLAAPQRDLATIQMLVRDGSPGTYLLEMLAEQNHLVVRWPDRRAEAIRVWIERDPAVPDWNPDFAVVAERAIEEWQRAGFPLRFLILRDSANTEIKIRWVAQFPEEVGPKLGMTRNLRDQHGWIHAAELTVATHDARGRKLPAETVAGTARHEIGHALGLGHSPTPTDVMFPESRTTAISATDRATLRMVYILPPGSVR